MDEDMEAAKKGIKPEPKPFEIKPPPGGPKIAPPPTPLKMPVMPQAKLGPSEKTKSFEMPKERPPLPPPGAYVQKKKFSLSPKFLILILIVLAVFAGAWWFMTRESELVVVSTPTPTPTETPIYGVNKLINILPLYPIKISSTDNFVSSFNNSVKGTPVETGKFIILGIMGDEFSYSLEEIFEKLNIPIELIRNQTPTGYFSNLEDWVIVAYGQQESFNEKGLLSFNSEPKIKIGLIAKTADAELLRSKLNSWEITITDDLKNLFAIDPQKATSQTFLDNIYSGTNVRYRNFPYADSSIDYAIVSLPEFNADYFILTSSRESIYSVIDLLLAQ